MFQRFLTDNLSRNKPFCLFGAKGVGKTTLVRDFANKFSNWIHLDLETAVDRAIFNFDVSADETLKAIGFLKDAEIKGNGTLIVLDEIARCPEAMRWVNKRTGGQADGRTGGQADKRTGRQADGRTGGPVEAKGPFVVATSSILTEELALLTVAENGILEPRYLYPMSFEEFLPVMDDIAALEAFREVPVPYYAYEKLLNYFHLYSLIGGMPEITGEYAVTRHLTGLRNIYEKIEDRLIGCMEDVTAGPKSRDLAVEVLQNTYPYAGTRISFNHFGNLEKGSREIGNAFNSLERASFLQMILPVTGTTFPLTPDASKFPRLQLLDTGLVNYFSGIQKPLFNLTT